MEDVITTISEEPVEAAPETPAADEAVDKAKLTEKKQKKLQKRIHSSERGVKSYQYFLLRVLIFIVVVWVLFFKIIGIVINPTEDMYPRVDAGDMVLFYRLDRDVSAQDVIVIEKSTPDQSEPQIMVLRVVAVTGDTVEISDGERLIVNGNTMIEKNIFYPTPRYEGFVEYPLTLGEDECFVLADSRDGGSDSRYFGVVKKSEILGSVITIVRRNQL